MRLEGSKVYWFNQVTAEVVLRTDEAVIWREPGCVRPRTCPRWYFDKYASVKPPRREERAE